MSRLTMLRRLTCVLLLAAIALAVAACGETHVGSSDLFNKISDKVTPTPAQATATAAPTSPPTARPQAATAPPVRRTPPPATPKPTPRAVEFEVTIAGDNTGRPQFDPTPVRVYVGTVVVFKNTDTQPRSVVADGGAFDSGPIAPGASWSWTASTAGTFDYHDGTRPYAVGTVQVIPH